MKKILAIMLIVLTLSAHTCFAVGEETSKQILLQNYEFGETFGNVRKDPRLFCIDFL